MDADFSIELGQDDPVLDFPWTDPDGRVSYFDLKRRPELLERVEEANQFPELREFLQAVNSARSVVESAKCDAWFTEELTAEEDLFGASWRFVSYVDLVFSNDSDRRLLPSHERFAKRLIELLRRTPEIKSSAEICVRRAYYAVGQEIMEGCYFTIYVSGYGDDEASARPNWEIALRLMANAIRQLSAAE